MNYSADIAKTPRHLLPADFVLSNWESVEPYFKELLERDISTPDKLAAWLKDQSELEAVISEDACWRQIKMTCDTENKTLEESFNFFCLEIQPKIQPYSDLLNKKLLNSPALSQLDNDKYFTYLRSVKKSIELLGKRIFHYRQRWRCCNSNTDKLPEPCSLRLTVKSIRCSRLVSF